MPLSSVLLSSLVSSPTKKRSRAKMWMRTSMIMGIIMFVYQMVQPLILTTIRPFILRYCSRYIQKFIACTNPYIEISIDECTGEHFRLSGVYVAIQAYLRPKTCELARKMKAQFGTNKKLILTMADYEEIVDEFEGIKIWWYVGKTVSQRPIASDFEHRHLSLQFHRQHREIITGSYMYHVIKEGEAILRENRQRKLYSNNRTSWNRLVFDHPVKFEHIAMDPVKKKEIIDDLISFSNGKEYYEGIGKAWKRGYLLYGPPGTGKSSMVAAMANLLNYDIYDLELTAVKDNGDLRILMHETSKKSIIVMEDIDCCLDITKKRNDSVSKKDKEVADSIESRVTLSGLLNVIDGLWSASSGERIIVFTTNHIENIDPALIRKGRMDKHIEMSYCCFEGFKVLAKNYLKLDSHELFETIENLISQEQITPADVAEHLIPKTINKDPEHCLKNLIQTLEKRKEDRVANQQEEPKAEDKSEIPNPQEVEEKTD
ncbi:AAA-ATPase At3g28580-like [Papaver somniferum]|uniref:AAA-ATPase At3g28580-like n=1 Tax=Papaver somniferum TaxID=3469 RepID=UPI000E70570E|nr:AAA-ATPase At3g28580-like [Papaver somniferum]